MTSLLYLQNDRREEENMGGSHHIDKHDSQ